MYASLLPTKASDAPTAAAAALLLLLLPSLYAIIA
jgi:hypothetical protein